MLPSTMTAVAATGSVPLDDERALVDVELPLPELRPRDVLVAVAAVSVNPVDLKMRARRAADDPQLVLGYDAAGTVVAVGSEVALFAAGDEVYYAGVNTRQGTNAEFHAVDERLVGRKPANLSMAEAAAMPLTTITAWESLFDRFALDGSSDGTLLAVAAAGGVGSILTQLARARTGITVIGTASRPESQEWVRRMGAQHVVDHHGDLAAAVRELAPGGVDRVFTPSTAGRVPLFAEVLRPFGEIVAIDDHPDLDLRVLKGKSIAWHWESMFTRGTFETPDMVAQHELLDEAAGLFETGTLTSTLTREIVGIDAASVREAHRIVASGASIGKVVLTR
ncbi:zinc-binding alcohol dehydrogenase family protein [Agromyces aerolatus]|uniref:zinc-binding alcohol dehydrogenase family protein n=1 Tax=Agromyces sp. LY-1074 TaxID=3074080 RepID=UPI0028674906|nr:MULTISPECIES: zinc-binding alcohol dehydrogenase family protein [unclassified Agromyces]MDR5698595.1 zinc-binding alcohol dehydrogenase family protein [Agromyces sp. LY-1074]MDR5704889.1 zinc-binding alcohol dehydrogenase family protein [Agromyces sp. LY-1358]